MQKTVCKASCSVAWSSWHVTRKAEQQVSIVKLHRPCSSWQPWHFISKLNFNKMSLHVHKLHFVEFIAWPRELQSSITLGETVIPHSPALFYRICNARKNTTSCWKCREFCYFCTFTNVTLFIYFSNIKPVEILYRYIACETHDNV